MIRTAVYQFLSALIFVLTNCLSSIALTHVDLSHFETDSTVVTPLPEEQYVPVRAHSLRRARVLWVNWDLFRSYGIDLGDQLTPELEQQLLDQFAYGVISPDDSKENFDENKFKVMYSEYYGGVLRGANLGSGRAASFLGKIGAQSKGLGKIRQMVRQTTKDHSNGKASLVELIREVIYGEYNHQMLPHGGNRVFLLLDRGTQTVDQNGNSHADAIVIREDPVRPAHFMKLEGVDSGNTRSGQRLNAQALLRLKRELGNDLELGISNYITRIATQYSHAFARRIYHGATSPSNIEVNGRFLDFGTQTLQVGHGRVQIIDHVEPAGEISQIIDYLVSDFVREIQERFQVTFTRSSSNFEELFRKTYDAQLRKSFLGLLGYNSQQLSFILETSEGAELSNLLIQFSTLGQVSYIGRYNPPQRVTRYDFQQFIHDLITKSIDLKNFADSDQDLVRRILSQYSKIQSRIEMIFVNQNSNQTLAETQLSRATILNTTPPELLRWNRFNIDNILASDYARDTDRAPIMQHIDEVVRKIHANSFFLKESEKFSTRRNSSERFSSCESLL